MELDGKTEKVLLRDVQWHAYKPQVMHVDFQRVAADQKIHMKVPLHFINQDTSPAVKISAAIVSHVLTEIDVSCLPAQLPEFITVDLANLTAGHPLHLNDVSLPEGVTPIVHGNPNPVLVIDEIDKAGHNEYDPLGAMYTLLEHDTAREFVDEFAEVPVDAADVIWVATANDEGAIPEPILSRMNVFEVPAPDEAGVIQIARSIYREIRNGHDWGRAFPEEPGEATMARLAELSPRDMRRVIFNAFGAAKLEGRDVIEAHDISGRRAGRRQRIGF
jgi:hypothetical protein